MGNGWVFTWFGSPLDHLVGLGLVGLHRPDDLDPFLVPGDAPVVGESLYNPLANHTFPAVGRVIFELVPLQRRIGLVFLPTIVTRRHVATSSSGRLVGLSVHLNMVKTNSYFEILKP